MAKTTIYDPETIRAILAAPYQVVEQCILDAIKDVTDGGCANLNEAARKHKVPPSHLRSG